MNREASIRKPKVLILGAYGLIGLEVVRQAHRSGFQVVGLGRKRGLGARLFPEASWIEADLRTLCRPESWLDLIADCDAVVNAAGVLQSGSTDDAAAVHQHAILALVKACEQQQVRRFVQISVPAVAAGHDTEFSQTKSEADRALAESSLDWAILRPGLVIGQSAYGGSALLRMLAAIPIVQPVMWPDRQIQTVALTDVAEVVVDACGGVIPKGSDLDLVEPGTHSLLNVVLAMRKWLGTGTPSTCVRLPDIVGRIAARIGDLLGHLGWRPPLRSTTLSVLTAGVTGSSSRLHELTGRHLKSLDETLAAMPANVQERWFARLFLAMPFIIGVLAVFWFASGVIGLLRMEQAVALVSAQLGSPTAYAAVAAGSVLDMALGLAVAYRPWARYACWGMAGVTATYLLAGSIILPHLWLDPLGPLVKTVPAMMLALITPIFLEDR